MLVPHAGAYGKRHRCSVGAYYLTGCGAECGAGYRLFRWRKKLPAAGGGWRVYLRWPHLAPLRASGGAWPRVGGLGRGTCYLKRRYAVRVVLRVFVRDSRWVGETCRCAE